MSEQLNKKKPGQKRVISVNFEHHRFNVVGFDLLVVAKSDRLLELLWQPLTHAQKLNPVILAEYIEQKIHFSDWQGLSEWIEKSLSKQWDDRLAYQYGRIDFGPAFTHLKHAEKWLKQQPHNPVLFLTLGRLACRGQLWGQARHYFTESLQLRPELETFHAMAKCYEAEGLESEAALIYKEAILQLEDKSPSRSKAP